MSVNRKNIQPKWKVYGVIVAILFGVQAAASVLSVVASFPTEAHRSVNRQITDYSPEMFSSDDGMKMLVSKEYKALNDSPENTYTQWALGLTTLAQFVLFIVMIFGAYRYLRKNRITSHAVRATVLLYLLATALVTVPTWLFNNWYTGTTVDELVLLVLLAGAPFMIGGSILVTFLVAKLAEWHYNRSHGFVED